MTRDMHTLCIDTSFMNPFQTSQTDVDYAKISCMARFGMGRNACLLDLLAAFSLCCGA